MKSRVLFTMLITLVLVALAGCNQPYQQAAPQATPTTIVADPNTVLFPATSPSNMNSVAEIITQTAQAGGGTPSSNLGPTSSVQITPNVTTTSTVPVLLNTSATATVDFTSLFTTSTPGVGGVATATATTSSGVVVATSTPAPVTSRPATYTLHQGEFPYCIARRFNVNPDELLTINGLTDGGLFEAGLVLKIPQTGNPFPASRVLHAHPTTYTVTGSDETLYGVACYFGDIDPGVIAQANNLAVSAVLTIGQKLNIP